MIVRGATQPACRLLDWGNRDLVWLLRACQGAGGSRTPRSTRESVKTVQVLSQPGVASNTAGPRAEPSGGLSDGIVVLDAELVPHSSKREFVQAVSSPPQSVVALI